MNTGIFYKTPCIKKTVSNGYTGTSKQYANAAFREIERIARVKYGATDASLLRYGHTNSFEAFAESFASLNSGAPTAFGKAMMDYLAGNRL